VDMVTSYVISETWGSQAAFEVITDVLSRALQDGRRLLRVFHVKHPYQNPPFRAWPGCHKVYQTLVFYFEPITTPNIVISRDPKRQGTALSLSSGRRAGPPFGGPCW
jgi:hypothetical protein